MATYGDTAIEYPYKPTKRKKQKYSLATRVIDFTNNLPIISGTIQAGKQTAAWAAGDVLRAIQIRAGQTVLGVQVEIITRSTDSGDIIDVGYGSDTDRWGRYSLNVGDPNWTTARFNYPQSANNVFSGPTEGNTMYMPEHFNEPLYFSSNDTIDIVIRKAAIQGKIRLLVHLLEDDR